jgi:hypothetical protein
MEDPHLWYVDKPFAAGIGKFFLFAHDLLAVIPGK